MMRLSTIIFNLSIALAALVWVLQQLGLIP